MGLKRGTYKAVFLNSPLTEFLLIKPIILLVTSSILDSPVYMLFFFQEKVWIAVTHKVIALKPLLIVPVCVLSMSIP